MPVCCFVNKAIIRKAGNEIMNFAENENSRILPNVQSPIIYFLMDGDEVVYVGQSKIGLARPYYHVLSMRYVNQNTFEEIAQATNWSIRKIFTIHGRALQEFERLYGKEYLENVQ